MLKLVLFGFLSLVAAENFIEYEIPNCHISAAEDEVFCSDINTESFSLRDLLRSQQHPNLRNSLSNLQIRGGNIPQITSGALKGYPGIRQLTLKNVSLSYIGKGAFHGMPQLKHLDLSNNQITNFPPETFKGIPIRSLILAGNPLTIPTNSPLLIARQLTNLDLSNCGIEHLPGVAFAGTPQLNYLSLNKNRMERLPQAIFEKIPLIQLQLANNVFRSFDMEVLRKVPGFPNKPQNVIFTGNPWHCDCDLREVVGWATSNVDISKESEDVSQSHMLTDTNCVAPSKLSGKSWITYREWSCED